MKFPITAFAAGFGIMLIGLVAAESAYAQCSDRRLAVNTVPVRLLKHSAGDKEMGGHNPLIEVWAQARITPNADAPNLLHHIRVSGFVRMTEEPPDFTKFEGTYTYSIFVHVPDGCALVGVDPVSGFVVGHGGADNHDPTDYPGRGAGLINRTTCISDTQGTDEGKLFCNIEFNDVFARITASTFTTNVPGAGPLQTTCDGPRTVPVPPQLALPLPHVPFAGDTEMAGHNPTIRISSELNMLPPTNTTDAAALNTRVEMVEDRWDFTRFVRFPVLPGHGILERSPTVYPGCRVSMIHSTPTRMEEHGGSNNHQWTEYPSTSGIIELAVCLSDTVGDDNNRLGCSIYFRPVQVDLVQE
jgi:hypothetical protein